MRGSVTSKTIGVVAIFWLLSVCSAFTWINRYTATPGEGGVPPVEWPKVSGVQRASDRHTLLVFLHPHCPCSRATLGELDVLLTRCEKRPAVKLLFMQPIGTSKEWPRTALWDRGEAIPGVEVLLDAAGEEASRFDVKTSGAVLLYNPGGRLVFQGGITQQRGHSGPNPGSEAILRSISTHSPEKLKTPAFGCELFNQWTTNLTAADD